MSSQKISSIKVPQFDRDNYNLWKKKMILFIKATNPLYMGILQNGPFVPTKPFVEKTAADGTRIPAGTIPKPLTEYSDAEKEIVALDDSLQLIIVDAMDSTMSHQILNCESGKHMWDSIKMIMEGTDEVKENRLDILTSQYEAFKSFSGESISTVFERYNRLLNELSIQGKVYPIRETNRKFMLTLPHHVEHRASSIRERIDFNTMSLEMIYGKLRTYEMEQEQRVISYGPGTVDSKNTALLKTTALVVQEPAKPEVQSETVLSASAEIIEAELASVNPEVDEDDYYTHEELEDLEDRSLAYLAGRFSHIRIKRNPKYKFRGSSKFSRGGSSSKFGSGSRSSIKTNMIDKSKIRCYNCNELGHFATECRKPRQATERKESYAKKDSYNELKKENERLKQKMDSMMAKHKGKAYIVEGKCWDDSDSEDEEECANFALMADSSKASSSQVSPLTIIDLTNAEYKSTVNDLSVEMFNIHTSLLASEKENARLVDQVQKDLLRTEKLELEIVTIEDLKQKIEYLEIKVKNNDEIEVILRKQISDLELLLQAYKKSANTQQDIFDKQIINQSVGIGYDYSASKKKKHVTFPEPILSDRKDVPHVLKAVAKPLFSKVIPRPLDETLMVIKEQLLVEDELKKVEEQLESPKESVAVKTELGKNSGKKNKSRNGKVDAYKKIDRAFTPITSRKSYNNCNSTRHLTHACNKVKVKSEGLSSMYIPVMHNSHVPCGKDECIPCALQIMNSYFKLMNASTRPCIETRNNMNSKQSRAKTVSPPKVRNVTPSSKTNVKNKSITVEKESVHDKYMHDKTVYPVKHPKPSGPKQVWVTKKP